jgi:hypothetical protein
VAWLEVDQLDSCAVGGLVGWLRERVGELGRPAGRGQGEAGSVRRAGGRARGGPMRPFRLHYLTWNHE